MKYENNQQLLFHTNQYNKSLPSKASSLTEEWHFFSSKSLSTFSLATEWECQGHDAQQLAGVPRARGILIVIDSLYLGSVYKFKTARI